MMSPATTPALSARLFGDLRAERSSPRVHQAIAKRTLEVIGRLGQEEKERRRELER